MSGRALAIETVALGKRFGAFAALSEASCKIDAGSFHALLGENGAGKSTLVKCIMGYYHPDDGSVLVDGREQEIANPRDAHRLGIGMVYQHFTLVPGMTVLENLVMARPDVPAVIDWPKERAAVETFLSRTPFKVPLDVPAERLAAGEKQKVEILKQLYLDRRFLILDEPTSVLTPQEADEVLGLLRSMTLDGRLTILMITHKFREVMAFADAVTVLRRGRIVGNGAVKDLTPAQMAAMMVGSEPPSASRDKSGTSPGNPVIEVGNLVAENESGARAVDKLSLSVRGGEILGIAGVSGNGQSQLIEVLAGQRRPVSGTVRVHGEPYTARRAEAKKHRVFCLPEEPLRNACVGKMSVAENIALRSFDVPPFASKWGWLNRGAMIEKANDLIARYRVKTVSADAPIQDLSGGNVQRAVLARELSGDVEVLVVANPCFGLDFAAVAEIRSQILAARNRGVAVLLVSEDLDEIFELADRIMVMFHGEIVHETPAATADLAVIGRAMAGH
jgi:simple sugar transport system ATP-binding protein